MGNTPHFEHLQARVREVLGEEWSIRDALLELHYERELNYHQIAELLQVPHGSLAFIFKRYSIAPRQLAAEWWRRERERRTELRLLELRAAADVAERSEAAS